MAIQVAIFRSYRIFLDSSRAKDGTLRERYIEGYEYRYEPISLGLIVGDEGVLDFRYGSGDLPYLIAEIPEEYTWSGFLGGTIGIDHEPTGDALPAHQLVALAERNQSGFRLVDKPRGKVSARIALRELSCV